MSGKNIIYRVDGNNPIFQKTFAKLKPKQSKEATAAFGLLFMLDTDQAPGKLHFHPLKDMLVPSATDPTKKVKVYTIHITADDTYKASFTLENGTAYLRACGEHDGIDKNP
jgi:hypothetical protein